jgi:hypothetical protein
MPTPEPGTSAATRRRSRAPLILLVMAVVLVLAAVGAVGVVALSRTETGSETASGSNNDGNASPTTTLPDRPSSSAPRASTTTTEVSPLPQVAEGVDGEFRINLPASLTYLAVAGDLTDLGITMFPDQPDLAAKMDALVWVFNGPGTRLVAIDPQILSSDQSLDPIELIGESGFTGASLDDLIAGYEQLVSEREEPLGFHIVDRGRLMGAGGEMAWFDIGNGQGGGTRHYLVGSGDVRWILICWTNDFAASREMTDQIAVSLEVAI